MHTKIDGIQQWFAYSNDVAWTSKRSKKDERIPCSTVDKSLSEHHIGNEGTISCMLTKTGSVLLAYWGLTGDRQMKYYSIMKILKFSAGLTIWIFT